MQSNGGTVVPLEKDANIRIADHIRKDAPPGSYSWRYIDKCVHDGERVNLAHYIIGRPEGTSRAVGSSEPAKATRTRFTTADDEILTKWVLEREKIGEPIKGNKIYEELEAEVWPPLPFRANRSWRTNNTCCSTLATPCSHGGIDGSRSSSIRKGYIYRMPSRQNYNHPRHRRFPPVEVRGGLLRAPGPEQHQLTSQYPLQGSRFQRRTTNCS